MFESGPRLVVAGVCHIGFRDNDFRARNPGQCSDHDIKSVVQQWIRCQTENTMQVAMRKRGPDRTVSFDVDAPVRTDNRARPWRNLASAATPAVLSAVTQAALRANSDSIRPRSVVAPAPPPVPERDLAASPWKVWTVGK